ncbi:hypothetical protein MA16_Dca026475 [Dendrobium catenatum]|uniref:Uncharacterized protein n=1 Tax=Dendrobium catenatum TaxID=906689 RepID=A0A2I0VI30_9ASPA|nr:hypothetical protein MA16_Dca026475 [Dendrobium catenatum]
MLSTDQSAELHSGYLRQYDTSGLANSFHPTVQKLRFRSTARKMKHPPERHGGDFDPSSPGKLSTVAPTPAVSFGDAIHHHYVDVNAEREQSSSSSDSDSDEDDFFQLQSTELGGTSTKPPTVPVFVDKEISVSAKFVSRKPPPPARYDVPDPNRIPMSVFARNTATTSPKDWSVASNDSLFSIQMGNSSFSREQGMFVMGRSEDLGNLTSAPLDYPPPRPPRVAVEGKSKLVDMNEVKEEEVEEEGMKEKEKTTGYPLVDSTSRQSDSSSNTSFGSFAFPV